MRNIDIPTAILIAFVVIVLFFLIGLLVADSKRPTFELKKDDWECTKSEHRTQMQPMQSGSTIILMPMIHTVCTQYVRKAT